MENGFTRCVHEGVPCAHFALARSRVHALTPGNTPCASRSAEKMEKLGREPTAMTRDMLRF